MSLPVAEPLILVLLFKFITIDVTARHLGLWWRIRRPRIAVAALNPHAGDGGIYGNEEAEKIRTVGDVVTYIEGNT